MPHRPTPLFSLGRTWKPPCRQHTINRMEGARGPAARLILEEYFAARKHAIDNFYCRAHAIGQPRNSIDNRSRNATFDWRNHIGNGTRGARG
ncbi:hypothetical protein BN2497_1955 [Janthinobacterium sp. CG23_2]|nr:hypothetical protein BN2497_1955 [Janthinobacterium sp. CG23_2]CUU27375.1 hypothetical protein BN3177_1955 [Janthinobacterium sp. CG23_2]